MINNLREKTNNNDNESINNLQDKTNKIDNEYINNLEEKRNKNDNELNNNLEEKNIVKYVNGKDMEVKLICDYQIDY